MNNVSYLLEQVWLAHKEMGLGPLVQAELWIIAILVACWLVERVVRRTVRSSQDEGGHPSATVPPTHSTGLVLEGDSVMKKRPTAHIASSQRLPPTISACIAALISVALLPTTALAQSGDMNCDGAVSVVDIPLFVEALLATVSFGGCDINRADMNADTLINGLDTQGFVAALLVPSCPAGFALCGGVCTDLLWDGANCGFCGNMCNPQDYCAWGACTGVCQGCEP